MRVLVLLLVVGCVRSEARVCGNGETCPSHLYCDDAHGLCVTLEQTQACDGMPEGNTCTAGDFAGICNAGYCVEGCGNGAIEDLALLGLGDSEDCDDGNQISRDGCSASCTVEQLTWTEWRPEWSGRLGHALAYDTDRDVVVMFGGTLAEAPTNEHWELTLPNAWKKVTPQATWPSARLEPVMAYDATRRVTVLFGGIATNGAVLGDTWEYDGQEWREVMVTPSPPARLSAGMAYDAVRSRMVLFGGLAAGGVTGDTWEYNGTWTQITGGGPAPRRYHQMAWDAQRQRIVMFGGLSTVSLRDTWSYVNGAWTLVTNTGPVARYSHQLAYSPGRLTCLLFSGATTLGFASDTWELGDTAWTLMTPAPIIPPPRISGAAVGIPDTGAVVLVGGRGTGSALDDVWQYSSAGVWAPSVPVFAPPGRENSRMVYDSTRGEAIVVGGYSGAPLNDTWFFDGAAWSRASSAMPASRYAFAAGYDPMRDRVVAFGGVSSGALQYGDTYELDPAARTWSAAGSRDPQRGGAMAFDPALGKLVLFGGTVGPMIDPNVSPMNQTWEYDGAWTQIATPPLPPAFNGPSMAHDPDRARLVLYVNNETWQRVDRTWSKLEPLMSPPPRVGGVLLFHPQRRRIWLYGGADGNTIYSDVWELAADGSTWTEVPVAGIGPRPRRGPNAIGFARGEGMLLYGGTATDGLLGDTWLLQFR